MSKKTDSEVAESDILDPSARHYEYESREPIGEPMTFSLDGEQFECYPEVHFTRVIRIDKELEAKGGLTVGTALEFLAAVMSEQEHQRFMDACEKPGRIVPTQTIVDIVLDLVTGYSARPTSPPSS